MSNATPDDIQQVLLAATPEDGSSVGNRPSTLVPTIAQAHATTLGGLQCLRGVDTGKAKAPRERGLGWWLGD